MERYNLEEDVKVFCATAKSFPENIQEAFITLEKMLSKEGRTFYGISFKNEKSVVVYKATVSESFKGEAKKYGFESFMITKGAYLTETITEWRKKTRAIVNAVHKLHADPNSDDSFPCVQWYKSNKEVMCMVKVK